MSLQRRLEDLERADPNVRRAAENYRRVVDGILGRRDADLSRGDVQCGARLASGDAVLSCRFAAGHRGKHKTVYVDGQEW